MLQKRVEDSIGKVKAHETQNLNGFMNVRVFYPDRNLVRLGIYPPDSGSQMPSLPESRPNKVLGRSLPKHT